MTAASHYILEVEDQQNATLAGRDGCRYQSPPQPAGQVLALARILLGCPEQPLTVEQSCWEHPIAGGRRIVRVHPAATDDRPEVIA